MSKFVFDDYARATSGGAKNIADCSPPSELQKQEIIAYANSSESGPDGVSSSADYIAEEWRSIASHLGKAGTIPRTPRKTALVYPTLTMPPTT